MISINAAVFAATLLASRLTESMAVFAFILFAFEIFVGFPMLSHAVKVYITTFM